MQKRRPVAIDLFCGAGGMSLGMERAGFDIALAVDYDGYHVATHERNFPYGRTKCSSVQELSKGSLFELAGLGTDDEVSLVFGGPPCQGFSAMGLRDAQDPRNTLIFHFARIVDEVRPKAFVMENVTGLNMGSTQPVFEAFLGKVGKYYNVTLPVRVLTATDFGVPQARRRLFVMGIRNDIGCAADYPTPKDGKDTPNVWQAIEDLPKVEEDDHMFDVDRAVYPRRPDKANAYALAARGFVRVAGDYSHARGGPAKVVTGCQRVKHSAAAIELYEATAAGEMVPGHKLPRLHPDGLCPTLRAGATSERGSHTAPRPVHPFAARVITAREAARLHGYPDWFSFYPSKMHAYRQIGNSVCPPVAHAVGLSVMRAIGVEPAGLPQKTLALSHEFVLPADRPMQHARIPVRVEFPKVIDYLWSKAFDPKHNKLRRAAFGPNEIRDAITATNANLPRVRPERFLFEAGQQRAIRDILATPLRHGYSIAIVDREAGTGVFQLASHSNSLGLQRSVVIRSADLKAAVSIDSGSVCLDSEQSIIESLSNRQLLTSVSSGHWLSLEITKDLIGQPITGPARARVKLKNGRSRTVSIFVFEASQVPFDRIAGALGDEDNGYGLVLLKLTNRHFASVNVIKQDGVVTEESRMTFVVPEPAPSASGVPRQARVKRA
jgi:DNA (cytosine-5)-methyltransferase 1